MKAFILPTAHISSWMIGMVAVLFTLAGVAPASAQQADDPLVDGVTVGGGLAFYQSDLDNNPNNNILKFLGSSQPTLFAQADRRYGRYALGLGLRYSRLAGERQFGNRPPFSFTNNAVSLDAIGSIDLGFPEPDLLRLFAGVGPTLFVSPTYEGLPEVAANDGLQGKEEFRDLGTQVQPNFMFGFSVQDAVHIGAKLFPTNYIDGFKGVGSTTDFLIFITIGYRFDLTN